MNALSNRACSTTSSVPHEVLLGLAREPHDDVGGHRDLRDRVADAIEPPQVSLATVGPLHRLEDGVRTRLQGEVDVLADLLARRHRLDHVGREVVRVWTREPDPAQIVNLVDFLQQSGEQGLRR